MPAHLSRLVGAVLALCAGGAALPAAAHDRTPLACDDGVVLSAIVSRFDHQVKHVANLPDVGITEFDRIHERRYLPFAEDRPIARRYCGASVMMTDGRSRAIFYLIEDRMGLAGIGDGIEFCVAGFDRWNVYNGGCRVLQ